MDKFRCQFLRKSWVRRAQGLQYLNFFHLSKGFFRCGGFNGLENGRSFIKWYWEG
jgi:hypothetical protein